MGDEGGHGANCVRVNRTICDSGSLIPINIQSLKTSRNLDDGTVNQLPNPIGNQSHSGCRGGRTFQCARRRSLVHRFETFQLALLVNNALATIPSSLPSFGTILDRDSDTGNDGKTPRIPSAQDSMNRCWNQRSLTERRRPNLQRSGLLSFWPTGPFQFARVDVGP